MRSIVVLALILGLGLGASFTLAGSARAGALGSPVSFGACGTLDVAGDEMSDPNTAFTNAETVRQCEQLCKKGGNLCKTSVNDSAACYLRLAASYRSFGNINCEIVTGNAQDERACKQSNSQSIQGLVAKIKSERGYPALRSPRAARRPATCESSCGS